MSESTSAQEVPEGVALPGELGWRLGMVLRGYQSRTDEALEGLPSGFRGFQVLSAVVHRDPPNQQALGSHLSIDRTVLTYLLDSMVEAGVIERVPDPTDRRARKIVATDQGREELAHYEARIASAEAAFLSGLTESDTSQFANLISRLATDVHRADPNASPCEAMDHL